MAITVGSYSNSNKYQTLVEKIDADILSNWVPQFETFCKLSNDNVAAKRVYTEYPVGQIGTHSDPITPVSHGATATQTVTPTAYSNKLTYTEIEEARDPGVIAEGAQRLMMGAKRTFEKLVFDAVFDGIATTTVPTGHSAAAKNIFSATHGYGSGSATQSNLGTAALSHSSLNDARVALRKWYNDAGEPMELDRGPLALIVPPELGDTARRLVGSPMYAQTFTDNAVGTSGATDQLASASAIGTAGGHMNPQNLRPYTVVESPFLSDANNWYLFSRDATPLNLWVPTAPSIAIIRDVANRNWVVSVLFEAATYWRAPVGGCFGASVS